MSRALRVRSADARGSEGGEGGPGCVWGSPRGPPLSAASKSTACDKVSAGLKRNVSLNRFLFLFF